MDFSVQPLCSLCLCGGSIPSKTHHRDTENTEVAQRNPLCRNFLYKAVAVLFRHLCEFVCEGVDHEFEAIRNAELRINRTEMMRDSGGADEESFSDLSIL